MDVLLAGFLYLVAVKVAANLLSSEIRLELDSVDERTPMESAEQAQLTRLRKLRDAAREATSG